MAWQRILVMGGDLLVTSSDEPALAFPLTPVSAGTAPIADWRGCAWVENKTVRIEAGTQIHEYAIGNPTADSVNYLHGWQHASKQRIRRAPSSDKVDRQYWYGWMDCWKERRGA